MAILRLLAQVGRSESAQRPLSGGPDSARGQRVVAARPRARHTGGRVGQGESTGMAGVRRGGSGTAANSEAGAEDGERIVSLHAGYETNGVYTDAFLARPVDGNPRRGVVLLSGTFGLSWTQREITRIYARAGIVGFCLGGGLVLLAARGGGGVHSGARPTRHSLRAALVRGDGSQHRPDHAGRGCPAGAAGGGRPVAQAQLRVPPA